MTSNKTDSPLNVREITKLLSDFRLFLQKMEADESKIKIINQFISIFKPYDTIRIDKIEKVLKNNFGATKLDVIEKTDKIMRASINDLKNQEFIKKLTKEELAVVAQILLGISRGKMMQLKRSEMESQIENALENIETLKIIEKNAKKRSDTY